MNKHQQSLPFFLDMEKAYLTDLWLPLLTDIRRQIYQCYSFLKDRRKQIHYALLLSVAKSLDEETRKNFFHHSLQAIDKHKPSKKFNGEKDDITNGEESIVDEPPFIYPTAELFFIDDVRFESQQVFVINSRIAIDIKFRSNFHTSLDCESLFVNLVHSDLIDDQLRIEYQRQRELGKLWPIKHCRHGTPPSSLGQNRRVRPRYEINVKNDVKCVFKRICYIDCVNKCEFFTRNDSKVGRKISSNEGTGENYSFLVEKIRVEPGFNKVRAYFESPKQGTYVVDSVQINWNSFVGFERQSQSHICFAVISDEPCLKIVSPPYGESGLVTPDDFLTSPPMSPIREDHFLAGVDGDVILRLLSGSYSFAKDSKLRVRASEGLKIALICVKDTGNPRESLVKIENLKIGKQNCESIDQTVDKEISDLGKNSMENVKNEKLTDNYFSTNGISNGEFESQNIKNSKTTIKNCLKTELTSEIVIDVEREISSFSTFDIHLRYNCPFADQRGPTALQHFLKLVYDRGIDNEKIVKEIVTRFFLISPFMSTLRLHTCFARKFIEIIVSGLCKERFKLSNFNLKLLEGSGKLTPISNAQESRVMQDQSCHFIWELSDFDVCDALSVRFEIDYGSQLDDALGGRYYCDFPLKSFTTLFTIKAVIEPARGSEFCRVGQLCKLLVTVSKLGDESRPVNFMCDIIADDNLWAISGRTAGLVENWTKRDFVLMFDLQPLVVGRLPFPTVRLSNYLSAQEVKMNGPIEAGEQNPQIVPNVSKAGGKIEPFDLGQVYNASRALQINVLPPSGLDI